MNNNINKTVADIDWLAKEWHPTKNGTLTPQDVTENSNRKVWWLLPYDDPETGKHYEFEWEASVFNRVYGKGCPYLNGKQYGKAVMI